MKTTYLGIESIVVANDDNVTIACNIQLDGYQYDSPIYSNIFCSFHELCVFLSLDKSNLCKKIISEIQLQRVITDNNQVQINLPDFIENQIEWKFPIMIDLKISEKNEIPIDCFRFTRFI